MDGFIKWIEKTYGSIGKVKVKRGKIHEYLGMKLDYSKPGQVSVNMRDYVRSMVAAFPSQEMSGKVTSPWNENLFKVNEESPKLSKE